MAFDSLSVPAVACGHTLPDPPPREDGRKGVLTLFQVEIFGKPLEHYFCSRLCRQAFVVQTHGNGIAEAGENRQTFNDGSLVVYRSEFMAKSKIAGYSNKI